MTVASLPPLRRPATPDTTAPKRARHARTKHGSDVARVLAGLPREFHVVPDPKARRRADADGLPVDHLVTGPGGTHLVIEKSWAGLVEFTATGLRQNGFDRSAELQTVREAAVRAAEKAGLPTQSVRPVVVLTDATLSHQVTVADVTLLPRRELRAWLTSRPAVTASTPDQDAAPSQPTRFPSRMLVGTVGSMAAHALSVTDRPAPRSRPERAPRAAHPLLSVRSVLIGLGMIVAAAAAYDLSVLLIHPLSRGAGVGASIVILGISVLLIRSDLRRSGSPVHRPGRGADTTGLASVTSLAARASARRRSVRPARATASEPTARHRASA